MGSEYIALNVNLTYRLLPNFTWVCPHPAKETSTIYS